MAPRLAWGRLPSWAHAGGAAAATEDEARSSTCVDHGLLNDHQEDELDSKFAGALAALFVR
jgi:hypothetical protein